MPGGFVHSVKVPRLYKTAAKIIRDVCDNGASLKSSIYEQKHPNVSAIYSLCLNTLQNETQLSHLINKTSILVNEPRLDPWLARILITELLWGKETLKTECKPAQTILNYEKQLRDELSRIKDIEALQLSIQRVRKPRYVRVNNLLLPLNKAVAYFQEEGWSLLPKCSTYAAHLAAVKNLSQPKFMQDFHIPELFAFPPDTTFHDHLGYKNGEIVLQDKASCLPVQLLNPEPGATVLDMCAAPGMKSSHLAALMKNQGKIYAVEVDERRYKTLCEQMKLTSASCVETINQDALTLNPHEYSDVEYILVDPTCSASGMTDRQLINGKERCPPQRLKQLQAFQVFLLRHALFNFPNVKKVVYSTCSIHPEENEQVVDEILDNAEDAYKLVSVKNIFKQNWLNYSSRSYKCSDKCLYAKPDDDFSNGFFVAVFERNFDVPLPDYKRKGNNASNDVQPEEKETSTAKKRKRRPKRKSGQNVSVEDSVLDASTESIKIIGERSQIDSNDAVEEPVVKKVKKKIIRKVKKQVKTIKKKRS